MRGGGGVWWREIVSAHNFCFVFKTFYLIINNDNVFKQQFHQCEHSLVGDKIYP